MLTLPRKIWPPPVLIQMPPVRGRDCLNWEPLSWTREGGLLPRPQGTPSLRRRRPPAPGQFQGPSPDGRGVTHQEKHLVFGEGTLTLRGAWAGGAGRAQFKPARASHTDGDVTSGTCQSDGPGLPPTLGKLWSDGGGSAGPPAFSLLPRRLGAGRGSPTAPPQCILEPGNSWQRTLQFPGPGTSLYFSAQDRGLRGRTCLPCTFLPRASLPVHGIVAATHRAAVPVCQVWRGPAPRLASPGPHLGKEGSVPTSPARLGEQSLGGGGGGGPQLQTGGGEGSQTRLSPSSRGTSSAHQHIRARPLGQRLCCRSTGASQPSCYYSHSSEGETEAQRGQKQLQSHPGRADTHTQVCPTPVHCPGWGPPGTTGERGGLRGVGPGTSRPRCQLEGGPWSRGGR